MPRNYIHSVTLGLDPGVHFQNERGAGFDGWPGQARP
jgi:hypothetical protein